MSQPGRPKKLDQKKRAEVCALVAAGVSVREAARYVGCDPNTIRREVQANHDFGRELQRAKSQAQVHPLRTMHAAAAKNWRAAAWWLERLAPEPSAHPGGGVFGQREANKFAGDLVEIIERAVSHPLDRERLYELVTAALPAAMRRTWDHRQSRRKLERALDYFAGKRSDAGQHTSPSPPPTPDPRPEPRPQSSLDRVLASFQEQLREHTEARRRSMAAGAPSAPANNSSPAASFVAPAGKNAAPTSPPHAKQADISRSFRADVGQNSPNIAPRKKKKKEKRQPANS